MHSFTATAGLAAAVLSAAATAQVVSPFTEDFEDGLGNWISPNGAETLGTAPGNSFASVDQTLSDPAGFGAVTVLAGTAGNGASGGAFAGDYLASGIDTLSYDVRHDAATPLAFSLRIATAANFPAVIVFGTAPVAASGEFTTVSFDLSLDNPLLVPEGGPEVFETTLRNVGNIQLLTDVPGPIEGETVSFAFDNVTIVPTPGVVATLGLGGLGAMRRRRG